MGKLTIRKAEIKDVPTILNFIKSLAKYEKLLDQVTATEDLLKESLFGKNATAECSIGFSEDNPVAFAVYFHNFSTFLGKPGLYLEDLFVLPEFRNNGYGKEMFAYLAKLAVERNCGRFEWAVLDWNKPALEFYKKLGAERLDEWVIHRLSGDTLKKLIDNNL